MEISLVSEEDLKMSQSQEMNKMKEKSAFTVSLESYDGWIAGDRCQWTRNGKKYGATVRWIGKLKGHRSIYAGLELDERVGKGKGVYKGEVLFHTRRNYAGCALISDISDFVDFFSKKTEDYFNKLRIVPIGAHYPILSSIAVSDEHPWRSKNVYQTREPPPDHSYLRPLTSYAPFAYNNDKQLVRYPERHDYELPDDGRNQIKESAWFSDNEPEREVEWHETIRLCDVEAFRKETAELARFKPSCDLTGGPCARNFRLSSSSSRRVLYRYVDAIKDSYALLEAIHFELFLPDRPDLRFIAVHFSSVPSGTVEGDYFRVCNVELLSDPSFAIDLEKVYPVVWEVKRVNKIEFESHYDEEGLAYIVKKNSQSGGETAISDISEGDLLIRYKLFTDKDERKEHSLMRVTMKAMVTAQLYPVEPPNPPPPPPPPPTNEERIKTLKGLSLEDLTTVYEDFMMGPPLPSLFDMGTHLSRSVTNVKLLKALRRVEVNKKMKEDVVRALNFGQANGKSDEVKKPVFDPRSEYLKLVYGVQGSSQRAGCVVSAVRALSASEAERIEDRLGEFTTYGKAGDLKLMDQLFRLGCRYRVSTSRENGADDFGEMKIDEWVVLKTILDDEIGDPNDCRPLLDCVYGRGDEATETALTSDISLHRILSNGVVLELNAAQSRAVHLYADADGPRVFCILSPPGSGKTTVAAAMAAEVARSIKTERRLRVYAGKTETYDHYSCVQLLLSVQNVAVDNMGAALKKMDYGGGTVYNMKSSKKMNPKSPAPFDYFDLLPYGELDRWKNNEVQLSLDLQRNLREKMKKQQKRYKWNMEKRKQRELEETVTHYRREYEKKVYPKIILSTVEMVLQKMYTDSKLVTDLGRVKRIIIDEASLLTEAALFAIIRRFPEARIVLIGDDKQLPPFLYDENILGHEMAGRPAISVALKTGKVPVVELNEVYRAPPSLIAPYNKLAYGGRLISNKAEGKAPLCVVGLVHSRMKQMLLIDVDGREEKNKYATSLYNKKELEALIRLLWKFPSGLTRDIMIICLYKEQKKRLEEMLDMEFDCTRQYTVLTVDSAQGKEAPIVIVLTTRTQKTTDFFCSIERCNVAVSRQQQALIILGSADLLTTTDPWEEDWKMNQNQEKKKAMKTLTSTVSRKYVGRKKKTSDKSATTVSLESYNGWKTGDRCKWKHDGTTNEATVKWIGKLKGKDGVFAGLELDKPVGKETGMYEGSELFHTRPKHSALVLISAITRLVVDNSRNTPVRPAIVSALQQKAGDYFNGLTIVPLGENHSILSPTAVSDKHPWRGLYKQRDPPPDHSTKAPCTVSAPSVYKEEYQLIGPPTHSRPASPVGYSGYDRHKALQRMTIKSSLVELNETIRLSDVEAFRKSTAEKARANANLDPVNALTAKMSRLSTGIRPVIYRYIDVIKGSFALLEARHFELFMPERPGLRFLAVNLSSIPSVTVEGDCFSLSSADPLSNPSFAVKLDKVYPVEWEAKQLTELRCESKNVKEGLAYIVKKKKSQWGGEAAISDAYDSDFFIRAPLFPDEDSRSEHSLVRVTMKKMVTAHLYAVEPPLSPPRPPPPLAASEQMKVLESLTPKELSDVYEAQFRREPSKKTNQLEELRNRIGAAGSKTLLEKLTNLEAKKFGKKKFDPRSAYLKRVDGVRSSSQSAGYAVSAVRALDASEAERIADRLGDFRTYGTEGDLELMKELFGIGSRYRIFASSGADADDAGETKIDEGIVLETIQDENIGKLEECRPLLDCIYGRSGSKSAATAKTPFDKHLVSVLFKDGTLMRLNFGQSRVVRLYADADGPRVFCILSPPGSGKTTVAAAMAAEIGRKMYAKRGTRGYGRRTEEYTYYNGVQLLLSVQNVAVDNMGAALKKMNYGGGDVYNMKSAKRLNPDSPAPYDFFDQMSRAELMQWRNGMVKLTDVALRNLRMKKNEHKRGKHKKETKQQKELEECITHYRREYERKVCPKIILSTVEMVLQKMYTESKLCGDLARVRRVIIDEASLLTEAALFAIIRRFPEARIVLIGDDKQLPPFMYEQDVLGHELAGRPALSVAMRTGRVPVVELNEVYRAPPSLVAPYNRLAYGGKLVSRKAEGEYPLSTINLKLVKSGRPQLLLIDVDGQEERNKYNMSLANTKERETLVRLLKKFPHGSPKEVMIICLYKEQKKRLQELLDKECKPRSMRETKYTVLTVDSAQGKEAPIVILMTTRTEKATDFFCSTQRCNVSVSRQQKALIILGKASLLMKNRPWSTVVNGNDFTCIKAESI